MHQELISKPRRRRRTYTPQFKTDLVAQCMDPAVSLAAVAIEHDLNPNVLRRWVITLMHDGIGVWLAARRLNQGRFVWPTPGDTHLTLTDEQASALVLGLPWQRLGDAGVIDCI
ncbi:hypothetical protein CDEN61S_00969 [Castellaniella denitrificans]